MNTKKSTATEKVKTIAGLPLPSIPSDSPLRRHCYLCSRPKNRQELDVEHIFPKVLFKGFDPGEYVKLWSCRECNEAKGLDDEFVVRYLQATSDAPAARAGFQNALRGFRREGLGSGLGRNMLNNMERVEVKTPSGIILGRLPAFKLNYERFDSFFTRIAKGLYVRTSLAIYDWANYEVAVSFEQGIQSRVLLSNPSLHEIRYMARYGRYWEHILSYFTDFTDRESISFLYLYSSYVAVITVVHKDALQY